MSRLAHASIEALSDGGALAGRVEGFAARPAQQRLTGAVAEAFEQREVLLAEAGTGTGKTYAYLVPALLSGLKTIVSTGTRALQDQLYHRDLPRVREALGTSLRSALLKGRANYLCHYRLNQAKGEARFASPEQATQFQRIVAWSGRTRAGDMAELEDLADDSPLLPLVTSTVDNCLGSECPFYEECFVVQARQRAQVADIVVVNHHLLLADLALKQEGFGEILPGAQAFVIDEAHQLPELAASFFGEGFGMRQIQELARDCLAECRQTTGALAVVQAPVRALEQALRELRAAMEALPPRGTRYRALTLPAVCDGFDVLADALAVLEQAMAPLAQASPGFEACVARARELGERIGRWRDGGAASDAFEEGAGDDEAAAEAALRVAAESPDERSRGDGGSEAARSNEGTAGAGMHRAQAGDGDEPLDATALARAVARGGEVYWYELSARGFRCQRTPLDVSAPLRQHREQSRAAWVFTSATLAVGGAFQHVGRKHGLFDPDTLLEPSPFDWPRQALCYLPRDLPEPNTRGFGAAMLESIRPVLEASGGRAFLLFASLRALREVAGALRGGPWPLFVQGEAPKAELLRRFRESGNGVLLGSASFREGVDVAGDALSVVVIDKLPFAAPDDPVFEARLEAVRRRGGNPFRDEQLPQAVIALKQGVGRLIRTESDRGVLVLCDPRLTGKPYGRVFMQSLPAFAVTRRIEDVQAFFAPE